MFSYEERRKAVELLIQYDGRYAAVIHELGYPSREALRKWYYEYRENGNIHEKHKGGYSTAEKEAALEHYINHGRCISRTIRALGYPSRYQLHMWVDEAFPNRKKLYTGRNSEIEYTREKKEQAVIDFCLKDDTVTAQTIADKHSVSRVSLYQWKDQLLGRGYTYEMPKKDNKPGYVAEVLVKEIAELAEKINTLEEQHKKLEDKNYRLQLQNDILEKAAEIIKKDPGVNLESLSNREKAILINALRNKYPLKILLAQLNMAKSSYCYQNTAFNKPDKYADLRTKITTIFTDASERYGYRRIHISIKNKGIIVSEKVVRKIMAEEHLVVPFVKKRKYSSYLGEISTAVDNIIARDFHADAPNEKWLTDLTEFHIPSGKIYLSPIIDCFDGLPVAWTIGTSPNAELANTMLDIAVSTLREDEHPIVHSDRGCHYRWPGWIQRMGDAKLTRSMSKKGCSPDNSACEGFFGRLKNEFFYYRSWRGVSIDEFIELLDEYIHWYSEKRIKESLGGMSPMEYRQSLGLVS